MAAERKMCQEVSIQVVAGVVLAGVLAVLAVLWGWLPGLGHTLGVAWGWLGAAGTGVIAFLAHPMPLWTLAAAAVAPWLLTAFYRRARRKPTPLPWAAYRRDDFGGGVIWSWHYTREGAIRLERPRCPYDLTEVILAEDAGGTRYGLFRPKHTYLYCERCGRHFPCEQDNWRDLSGRIIRLIEGKIQSGDWKKVIEESALLPPEPLQVTPVQSGPLP